jgi:predicted GNAT family N-acyltransferase|tara:strand:- start:684 stop:1148 length:465 start_codon:yes stop_codon:yes gene_type:complete
MSSDLNIRKFDIREAGWETDGDVLQDIRRRVFIIEQHVPKDEEWDGQDEKGWHFIATEKDDVPIGTARLLPSGQIGRMAVLEEYRRHGVGRALLEQAIEKARHLGMQDLFLHVQLHALHFYEAVGFSLEGEEFIEAGIAHRKMTLVLTPLDDNV